MEKFDYFIEALKKYIVPRLPISDEIEIRSISPASMGGDKNEPIDMAFNNEEILFLVDRDVEDNFRCVACKLSKEVTSISIREIFPIYKKMRRLYSGLKLGMIECTEFEQVFQDVYQSVVCNNLFQGTKNIQAICGLINEINRWSNKKYEGKDVSLIFIINQNEDVLNAVSEYTNFLKNPASAVISDKDVAVEFSLNGYKMVNFSELDLSSYVKNSKRVDFVPHNLVPLSKYCGGNKVGIVLSENKDLLFINNREIAFAKRSGEWTSFNWNSFCEIMYSFSKKMDLQLIRQIFLCCINVSFSHVGGGIVIVDDDLEKNNLKKYVDKYDLLNHRFRKNMKEIDAVKMERHIVLKKLINERNFKEINETERTAYLGIDGATIINTEGRILAVGAILNGVSESSSGARTAALKGITNVEKNHCIAIKISEDGYIAVYKNGEQILRIS